MLILWHQQVDNEIYLPLTFTLSFEYMIPLKILSFMDRDND